MTAGGDSDEAFLGGAPMISCGFEGEMRVKSRRMVEGSGTKIYDDGKD